MRAYRPSWRRWLVLALCMLQAAGCIRLQERTELTPTLTLGTAADGALADVADRVGAQLAPNESAYWLLDRNELALTARLALADTAAQSLDVQYFIWQEDATGHLLAGRLLDAAERGVRVRLLLDDFGITEERGDVLHLDAHPLIEVRVFNPWVRRGSRVMKGVEFLVRARELNRRMHNKTIVADGHFAVLGGRNIGDRYFGVFERFVQNDLDVLVAGPLVSEVAESFDVYWNSSRAYPMTFFRDSPDQVRPLDETRSVIASAITANADTLAAFIGRDVGWTGYFDELVRTAATGSGELLYDLPQILDPAHRRLYEQFKELLRSARRDVLISSPYFIPDEEFRALLGDLVARGVRVRIITNSLASNNHAVAHTGYRRWRRDVLGAGVELYELRADAAALDLYLTPPVSPDALGLHTKAMVIDGRHAFIGSPNVDPRSMELNTEIGIVADSPELARRLQALIERDMRPENAWRLTMDEEGWLTWSNDERSVTRQPARNFAQRLVEFLLNLLPIKNQA